MRIWFPEPDRNAFKKMDCIAPASFASTHTLLGLPYELNALRNIVRLCGTPVLGFSLPSNSSEMYP